jgi:hypothetical protein
MGNVFRGWECGQNVADGPRQPSGRRCRRGIVVLYSFSMKSPFPGMDPYLEAHWLDVHPRLIVESANAIGRQLGDDLVARIEERLVVEDPIESPRAIGPDVRVVEHGLPGEAVRPDRGVAVTEPMVLYIEAEPIAQRFIEIRDLTTGGKVVTVIEFLSPSNKLAGDGREKYLQKQAECRQAGVNLVEIDLTRAGRRQLLAHRWTGARARETTFAISVWRAASPARCSIYSIPLQQRLPAIHIPLRPADPQAVLDVQAIVDATYVASRYHRTTDYTLNPDPPLGEEDAAWADVLLKSAGKR